MLINLLYFDGCPSWQLGLENLNSALNVEGMQAEIRLVSVENNTEAARLKFLGSPSFQIGGVDLFPEVRTSYALSCRVYSTPKCLKGAPDIDLLRQKLRLYLNTRED